MWAALWSWVLLGLTGVPQAYAAVPFKVIVYPCPEYTFMVRLVDENTHTHICSGVLVAGDMVVTTASCLRGRRFPHVTVGSGCCHDGSPPELMKICQSRIHESFSGSAENGGDIALLFLKKALQHAKPITGMRSILECPSDALSMVGWPRQGASLAPSRCQGVSIGFKYTTRFDCEKRLGVLPGGVVCATERPNVIPFWDHGAALLCDDRDLVGLQTTLEGYKHFVAPRAFVHMWGFKEWIEKRGNDNSTKQYNRECSHTEL
ncbi:unnamed protein product [Ostreobium quekettii]|uniref:Peptidase S1 domain-containing protein n=1 Tax=Ostreobium quekettii TaxID=121088 RepID=A0A8S1J7U7_9CHLO|nr:unnamed protein product [Ostreobium quekettii]